MNNLQQNNIRLFNNTIVMYARTFIVMLLSLYITRALLQKLGVDNYGVYNVVGVVVVLFTFLNTTLTQTIQQFLTIEIGSGTKDSIIKVFNASLVVQTVVAIVVFLFCETIGLYVTNYFLNVGSKLTEANWVFQFSVVTAIINIFRVPFEALVVSNEKMTFFALASIADAFMKLGIVFLIPDDTQTNLVVYAALLTISWLISFILYVIYCRKTFDTCVFRKVWDKVLFKHMINFSGWNLCGSVTNLSTQNIFGVLLNVFYGVAVNAALGVTNQVNSAINQFIGNFQTSFRPQIVKAYASGETSYYKKLISATSKFSYLLIFIPCMVLIVNMPYVLGFWLGSYPRYTDSFCRLILVCCMFDALTGAYYCAISATGNIKRYQIAISISFIIDLMISSIMMLCLINPEFLLFSRIATRGVLNMYIGLFELNKLVDFDVRQYHTSVVIPLVIVSVIVSVLCLISMQFLSGWLLFCFSTFMIIVCLLLSYHFVLSESERGNLKLLFCKVFLKSRNRI